MTMKAMFKSGGHVTMKTMSGGHVTMKTMY